MTKDLDRGITEIKYNLLNLPEEITFSGGEKIKNLYAADGRKLETFNITSYITVNIPIIGGGIGGGIGGIIPLRKQTFPQGYGTLYADNKEYLYDRKLNSGGYILTPFNIDSIKALRVHNTEGYVDDAGNYYYYRRDHLGNNREVWQFPPSGGQVAVIQRTQYYPSGLPWAYTVGDGADKQPYKYGGKEFIETHGYDSSDFHARMRMGAVPVFPTQDPLAEDYPEWSPYVYCFNNPMRYTDYNGMQANDTINGGSLPEVVIVAPKPEKESQLISILAPDYNLDGKSAWWEWLIDGGLYAADLLLGGPTGESLAAKSALVSITAGAKNVVGKTAAKGVAKLTNKQIIKLATKHGMKEAKEFGLKNGQKVFKKGNKYYSYDVDGHNGGVWKVFEKIGGELKRIGTANEDLVIFKK